MILSDTYLTQLDFAPAEQARPGPGKHLHFFCIYLHFASAFALCHFANIRYPSCSASCPLPESSPLPIRLDWIGLVIIPGFGWFVYLFGMASHRIASRRVLALLLLFLTKGGLDKTRCDEPDRIWNRWVLWFLWLWCVVDGGCCLFIGFVIM